eukprot:5007084-Pyramimonas_sp.AAC.1
MPALLARVQARESAAAPGAHLAASVRGSSSSLLQPVPQRGRAVLAQQEHEESLLRAPDPAPGSI